MSFESMKDNARYSYLFGVTLDLVYPISFGYECGKGWWNLIDSMIKEIRDADPDRKCRLAQIKSKFGELRVYTEESNPDIEEIITKYEKECYDTCEACGQPATHTASGWITRLCDECK